MNLSPDQITQPVKGPSNPETQTTTLIRLLSLLTPFKGLVILSVIFGAVTVVCGIGLMATSAYIISAAALQPSIAVLQIPIVGVRFFGISRGLSRYLERYVSHDVAFRLLSQLRVRFYQALEPLAPARLQQFQSGDLLNRLIEGVNTLENFYVRAVAPPFVAMLVMLFSALFLASYDLSLTFTISIFWIALGIGVPVLIHILSHRPGRNLVHLRAELNKALIDGIQGMPDLQAFNAVKASKKRINSLTLNLAKTQTHLAKIDGLQISLGILLANTGAWMILILSIQLVNQERIEGLYLASLVLVALTSFEALYALPDAAKYLENSLEAARRLIYIIDAEPEVKGANFPIHLKFESNNSVLDIQNLWFKYPIDNRSFHCRDESQYVLEDISFSLQRSKRLALVGPSGAGKTTLVNILLRFWEFEEGKILFCGNDIRLYNQTDVRRMISVVSQHTYLFNTTIRENLLIANPDAKDSELFDAAEQAQIHNFIQSLPNGYDTWIGEQGHLLSGGERQRIAIARALLKNAPLLILDEATVNLDVRTEHQVIWAIQKLMNNRTTLMITHRLTMLDTMDEVIVLDKGRIVERNTHQELLQNDGLYKRMWNLQHTIITEE
jgi:thiol reductant ABC exporter CydC subunit